jgi:hypothetical protein
VRNELGGAHIAREAVMFGHIADVLPQQRAIPNDIVAEHRRRPIGGFDQSEEDLDERALARPVRANQPDDPGLELQVEPGQGGNRASVALHQAARLEDRHERQCTPNSRFGVSTK